ncbi:MAG TPA: tetratricopeptide repeat protein, partial [Pseudonocardiaceae bacterium]|nr:tetratricopeptide repeat protein [Pseudonocardiaceae bacterium]
YRSVGDLADDLEDTKATLNALEAGDKSVRAAFEVSYRALDTDQQRAFRVLGEHPGPELTTQVLAALGDLPPGRSRQLLKNLAERNLVEELPSAGVPGGARYRFHDLIRSYAGELAAQESADRAGAWQRLLRSYRQTVRRADQLRRPGHVEAATDSDVAESVPEVRDSSQARKWLVSEQENLLGYIRSVPPGLQQTMAADLVDMSVALARHYRLFGYYAEARAYYDQVLEVYDFGENQHATAEALRGRGQLARLERDHDAAREDLQRALEIHTSMTDKRGMADCLRALGNVARQAGDPQRTAREHLQHALEIYRKLPDTPKNRFAEAHTLEGMGNLERDVSEDLPTARRYFERALAIYRELGNNPLGEANSLRGLGDVERLAAAHSDAQAHLEEALRIYETLGDPLDVAKVLWRLGRLAADTRDSGEACRRWSSAVAIFDELGDPFVDTVRGAMRQLGC